eukprot:1385056-Prymnesium_polylepis.1
MISAVARVFAPAPAQPNLTCPCLPRAPVPQETGPTPTGTARGGEPDHSGLPEHAQRHLNLNLLLLGCV